MLTGDLLRVTRRKGRVQPRLVDPGDAALLERAAALIAAVTAALPAALRVAPGGPAEAALPAGTHGPAHSTGQAQAGQRRGDLERALDLLAPAGAEHQVERGLVKLLLDRCTFETRAKAEPAALREALFDRSAAGWRARPLAELPQWRAEALREAGAALRLTAQEAEETLYADLEANQVLAAFAALSPARLLLRYNVALVQGLLLRADALEVRAPWPEPARLRQLFRWLKFFGLLFEARRESSHDGGGLRLTVDGPLSVLEHAGRYGLNLAQFCAALLLWPGPWRLSARVRVGRRAQAADLELEPHPWLQSPLPDQGAWVPEAVRDFVAAFNAQPGGVSSGAWRAEPAERIVLLAGNAYLIPDFEFVATADGRRVLLEHVLYPSPERIARLLERAREAEIRAPAGALSAATPPGAASGGTAPPAATPPRTALGGTAPPDAALPDAALPGAAPGGAVASADDPPFQVYWIACKRAARLPQDARLLAYRRTLLASQVRAKLETGAEAAGPETEGSAPPGGLLG